MNTIDNDATQFDGNATVQPQSASATSTNAPTKAQTQAKPSTDKATIAKRVGLGVAGAAAGVGAAAVISHYADDDAPEAIAQVDVDSETPVEAEVIVDEAPEVEVDVNVAPVASDDMTFAEAFSAARQAQGPGGTFEWHGQVYGTYTEDEWARIQAQQAGQSAPQGHYASQPAQTQPAPHAQAPQQPQPQPQQEVAVDDDIHVVETEPDTPAASSHSPFAMSEDSEVEVIGVMHNDELDTNVASITVDGQEAILVDIDGDMQFDYIQADFNGDGMIASNEISAIDDQGLTVADLGGFSDATPDLGISDIATVDDIDNPSDNPAQYFDEI